MNWQFVNKNVFIVQTYVRLIQIISHEWEAPTKIGFSVLHEFTSLFVYFSRCAKAIIDDVGKTERRINEFNQIKSILWKFQCNQTQFRRHWIGQFVNLITWNAFRMKFMELKNKHPITLIAVHSIRISAMEKLDLLYVVSISTKSCILNTFVVSSKQERHARSIFISDFNILFSVFCFLFQCFFFWKEIGNFFVLSLT